MTTEEAAAELGIELGWNRKVSCPKHSDTDPSLHIYPDDRGWYCFACNAHGDGWGLLAHYLDVPVGQLMRDRGVAIGPRPRTRWEQLDELGAKAANLRVQFQRELKRVWAADNHRYWLWLQTIEGRVDEVYGDLISARYFPEDLPPNEMEKQVRDLERFYLDALHGQRLLRDLVNGE